MFRKSSKLELCLKSSRRAREKVGASPKMGPISMKRECNRWKTWHSATTWLRGGLLQNCKAKLFGISMTMLLTGNLNLSFTHKGIDNASRSAMSCAIISSPGLGSSSVHWWPANNVMDGSKRRQARHCNTAVRT